MPVRGTQPAYGVIFHPSFPPETLPDYARRAEAAGFDELWLWNDSFQPGAYTSAAVALSATRRLRVGIGLSPVTVYNPLFAAMEITTLARAFPGRFLPGFGHGVRGWLEQTGAAPASPLKALEETVSAVRRLLRGERVTLHGSQVHLDDVQMQTTPDVVPPLYVGGIREKTLRLAGQVGDGTILTGMSSPDYIRWALEHIRAGAVSAGRSDHRVAVYLDVKVNPDGEAARAAVRRALAERLPWEDAQLHASGIAAQANAFLREQMTMEEVAQELPEAWIDLFSAAGDPQQVAGSLRRWTQSGVASLIFQPLNGDPDCLDEYARYLAPLLEERRSA